MKQASRKFNVNNSSEGIQRLVFTYDLMKSDSKRKNPIRTQKNYITMLECAISEIMREQKESCHE